MYEHIAPYYDQIHASFTEDVALVLALAGRVGRPVLELGCGSGRLLLPLARAGYQVTGLDNSPAMLALARERLEREPAEVQQRVTLLEGDMVAFDRPGEQYRLAVVACNTIMHLTPPQLVQTLRGVHRSLTTDGWLLLDMANPFVIAATENDNLLTLEHNFLDETAGQQVLVMAHNRLDEEAQVMHVTWLFDVSPVGGGPVQRTVATSDYFYLFPHEVELRLAEAGFALEALYGDYGRQAFDEESGRLIVLARPA